MEKERMSRPRPKSISRANNPVEIKSRRVEQRQEVDRQNDQHDRRNNPQRGDRAGALHRIAQLDGVFVAGADIQPFDQMPELLLLGDDESAESLWPGDQRQNSERDSAEDKAFEGPPGDSPVNGPAEAVQNRRGEIVGTVPRFEVRESRGESAHKETGEEAHCRLAAELHDRRFAAERERDAPQRRQKFADGGFRTRSEIPDIAGY